MGCAFCWTRNFILGFTSGRLTSIVNDITQSMDVTDGGCREQRQESDPGKEHRDP